MQPEKTCFKCLLTLPLDDFYKFHRMADGHLNKCKRCAREDALQYRAAHIEDVREKDRVRNRSADRRAQMRDLKLRWRADRPERVAAQVVVRQAIERGQLLPWPVCAVPGCCARPEAHHPDYDRPLDVVWLCRPHHMQAHAIAGAKMPAQPLSYQLEHAA